MNYLIEQVINGSDVFYENINAINIYESNSIGQSALEDYSPQINSNAYFFY